MPQAWRFAAQGVRLHVTVGVEGALTGELRACDLRSGMLL